MARKSRKKLVPGAGQGYEDVFELSGHEFDSGKETQLPVGGYIRLSSENKIENSIQSQIAVVKSYIAGRSDLALVNLYIDNGFTGTNFDRPEFIRMMDDVGSHSRDSS